MKKLILLQLLHVSSNKLKSVETNFVATDPFCESNVVFPDALSDTCTGRTFQDGKSCQAQCLEKVVLTCSCMTHLFGVIWIAKPDHQALMAANGKSTVFVNEKLSRNKRQ